MEIQGCGCMGTDLRGSLQPASCCPFPGALLGAGYLPQTPSLALFRESCFGVCGVVKEMTGSSTLLGYQPWARRGTVNSPLRSPGLGKREPSVAIPGTDGLNYLTLKGQQDGGLGLGLGGLP